MREPSPILASENVQIVEVSRRMGIGPARDTTAGKERKVEQREQRILLVEDDADVRELLRTVLENAGYAIIAVEQGEAALSVLKTTPCDLLVTDYHLPDMLGNRLIKQARTNQPGISTVLISGEPGVEYLASQCGAHAWFRKGEMLDGLLAAVTAAFGTGDATQKNVPCLG